MTDRNIRIEGSVTSVHSHPGTYFLAVATADGTRTVLVSDAEALDHEDLSDGLHQALVGHNMQASGVGVSCVVEGTLLANGDIETTPAGISRA